MDSQSPATLTPGLLAAYRQAAYTVHDDGGDVILAVGRRHPRLDALLERLQAGQAALITACNPCSRPLPAHANRRRMKRLELALTGLGLASRPATNRDPDGRWPDEPALVILAPSQACADAVATRFGQWAYLWLARGTAPVLRARASLQAAFENDVTPPPFHR